MNVRRFGRMLVIPALAISCIGIGFLFLGNPAKNGSNKELSEVNATMDDAKDKAKQSMLSGKKYSGAGDKNIKSPPRRTGSPSIRTYSQALDESLENAKLISKKIEILSPKLSKEIKIYKTEGKYPYLRVGSTYSKQADGSRQLLQRKAMIADHFIVKLKPGSTKNDLETLNQKHDARILKKMLAKDMYLVALAAPTGPSMDIGALPRAIEAYQQAMGSVAFAEPDYVVFALELPGDPRFNELYGMHNTGQTGGTSDADIDAPEAWDIGTGSRDIKVGVIDTGIDYTHPDLAANIYANPGETGTDSNGNDKRTNGLDDDGNGFIDDHQGWDFYYDDNNPTDGHYHGTHCAGTIGALGDNNTGVAGVCWQVSLVPLKFLSDGGSGSTSDAIDTVTYATTIGVDITSNSWGGGGFSQGLNDAIQAGGQNNILFIAAAGNSSTNTDNSPHYPSSYDLDCVISVAAVDHNDSLASFSNYGAASVDLGAPGVNTLSCSPGTGYRTLSGTSMATPHVAGVCALLKSLAPSLTSSQIRAHLLDNVDPVSSLSGRCVTGGRLNAFNTILNGSLPVIALQQTTLDDDSVGGSIGNGDGILNPGESVDLTVLLKNIGGQDATGVSSVLSLPQADANVTILQDSADYGDMARGTQITGDVAYRIAIDENTPTPHTIGLQLNISDADGNQRTESFELTVNVTTHIGGLVISADDGQPVANAIVSFTGPVSGSTNTDANGRYDVAGIDGTYTFAVSSPGFIKSAPQQTTVPPDVTDLDFSLNTADILVNPAQIVSFADEERTITTPLAITNVGDQPIQYRFPPSSYSFSDSTQPGGPAYDWIEISQTGTQIGTTGDDWNLGAFPIGFAFPFYDQQFSSFRFCSNGWISFTNSSTTFSNRTLPNTSAPENMIAACWDDLYFSSTSKAYYQLVDASTLVIELKDVQYLSTNLLLTCEIILKADGRILLQYQNIDRTSSCTVGIQNGTKTVGLQVSYNNSSYPQDNMAIEIHPGYGAPWSNISPAIGTIAAGSTENIVVGLDARGLPPGDYTTQLGMVTDDPDEPLVIVPVTFTVLNAPVMQLASWIIDDDNTGPSAGDGDGVAEPGETIEIHTGIRNLGHATGSGLSGQLATTYPDLTFLSDQATYPNAAPSTTVSATGSFVVEISPTAAPNSVVQFTLQIIDDQNRIWIASNAMPILERHTLTGTVTDLGTAAALPGATVQIAGRINVTDSAGHYEIPLIPPGTHDVLVSKSGYSTLSQSAVVTQDATLDFALGYPNIELDEQEIEITLNESQNGTTDLGITNTGSLPLTWSASVESRAYKVEDSRNLGGIQYNWIEISETGTEVAYGSGPHPIGFNVPFYDQFRAQFYVSRYGYITLTNSYISDSGNARLPSVIEPSEIIALLWDYNYAYRGGKIYYQQMDSDTIVIEYKDFYQDYNGINRFTAEIILTSDGSITMQYQRVDIKNASTVGVQNNTGTKGVTIAHLDNTLAEEYATRLVPTQNWLSISPTSGNLEALASEDIELAFDTTNLTGGRYYATLNIQSNDLETAAIQVPVTLTINKSPRIKTAPWADPNPVLLLETTQLRVIAEDDGIPGTPGQLTYTWSVISGPGTASFSTNGGTQDATTASFTEAGTYQIRVSISDGMSDTVADCVVIVTPEPNEAPIASDQAVTTNEETAVAITLVAIDPDGHPLTFEIIDYPLNGELTGSNADWSYLPNENFTGSDRFTFKASDGKKESNLATVNITIQNINDVPEADAKTFITDEDTPTGINISGTDSDNDVLTFEIVTPPQHGQLTGILPNPAYIPDANFHGEDHFTYIAKDALSSSTPATINITIRPVNDLPQPIDQILNVDEDQLVSFRISATDPDGDPLTYALTALPQFGSLSGSAPNLTYHPALNFHGTDTILFVASDATAQSTQSGRVTIHVRSINDAPVAVSATTITPNPAETGEEVSFFADFSDADGDTLRYHWNLGDGQHSDQASAQHIYTTPGTYDITLTVEDNHGGTTVVNKQLTVEVQVVPQSTNPIEVRRLKLKITFADDHKDACILQGTVNLPAGFNTAGQRIVLDVGGAQVEWTLDSRGRAKSTEGIFSMRVKSKKGQAFAGGPVKFVAKMLRGEWYPNWKSHGMIDETVRGAAVTVPVRLNIDALKFGADVNALYTAKSGKAGRVQSKRR